jgi:tetratricopeptide (TPR) repeat protein
LPSHCSRLQQQWRRNSLSRPYQEALTAGKQLFDKDQFKPAKTAFEQALELARKAADRKGEAQAMIGLGKTLVDVGDPPAATTHFSQALELYRAIGDNSGEAAALHGLGSSSSAIGDQSHAMEYYGKALSIRNRSKIGMAKPKPMAAWEQVKL